MASQQRQPNNWVSPNDIIPQQFRNWFQPDDFLNDLHHWNNFRNWTYTPWQQNRSCNKCFKEYADRWELEVELPGRRQDEIQLWIEGQQLEISATERQEMNDENNIYRNERTYKAWKKNFELPSDIDHKKITGKLLDGLLHIILPRQTNKTNTRHQIQLTNRKI